MSTKPSLPPIPAALRDLLAHPWNDDADQSWDAAWQPDDKERQRDPSGYILRPEGGGVGNLRHEEVVALAKAGLLSGLVGEMSGGALWVNEHADHAIRDFAAETFAAWRKLRIRLAMAAAAHTPGQPFEPEDSGFPVAPVKAALLQFFIEKQKYDDDGDGTAFNPDSNSVFKPDDLIAYLCAEGFAITPVPASPPSQED